MNYDRKFRGSAGGLHTQTDTPVSRNGESRSASSRIGFS